MSNAKQLIADNAHILKRVELAEFSKCGGGAEGMRARCIGKLAGIAEFLAENEGGEYAADILQQFADEIKRNYPSK